MNKFIFIAIVIILLCQCTKESLFDEYGGYGKAQATTNGKSWNATPRILLDSRYLPDSFITIQLNNGDIHAKKSEIYFSKVPLKTGHYLFNPYNFNPNSFKYDTICGISAADLSGGGGEYTIIGYYLLQTPSDSSNYLDIKELNLKTGDIKGSFRARLTMDSAWTWPGIPPDTLLIENGSFYGKIYWK